MVLVQLQCPKEDLILIKKGASKKSLNVSAFIRSCAIEEARKILCKPSIEELFQKALTNSLTLKDIEKKEVFLKDD